MHDWSCAFEVLQFTLLFWQKIDSISTEIFIFQSKPLIDPFFTSSKLAKRCSVNLCAIGQNKWKSQVAMSGEHGGWGNKHITIQFFYSFLDNFCDVGRCIVMKQYYLSMSLGPSWTFSDQYMIRINYLLSLASSINRFTSFEKFLLNNNFLIPPTQNIVLAKIVFAKRFGVTVDVDGWLGSTHDFAHLKFSKYIHFASPLLIRYRKLFVYAF